MILWQTKVPLRVGFFFFFFPLGWPLSKIFTMDNLRKWHVIVVDRCCICKKDGESVDHLLIYYEVACALWNDFSVALGCPGLCLVSWLICLLPGGLVVALQVLSYGR
jgi:hypothetical protein